MNANLLRRWVQAYQADETDACRGNSNLTAEQEELRRLREENRRLKQERDILKNPEGACPCSRGRNGRRRLPYQRPRGATVRALVIIPVKKTGSRGCCEPGIGDTLAMIPVRKMMRFAVTPLG